VKEEYLWTSGMAVDCKESFSWCSINQKIDFDAIDVNVDLTATGNCLAVVFSQDDSIFERIDCDKKLLFVCEVIKFYIFTFRSGKVVDFLQQIVDF